MNIIPFVSNLPTWLEGLIFMGSWVVFGVLGLLLVKRLIHKFGYHEHIHNSKDQIIALLNILSILFAVLMAFLVVVVWEKYDKNSDNVEAEGNNVGLILRDCKLLPTRDSATISKFMTQYADTVILKEWATMDTGKEILFWGL